MKRGEPFGVMMERELRRIGKMPYRTLPDRKTRCDALSAAVVAWRQRQREAIRRASEPEG